jgi:SOS-response transcriptional repressor LexA
MTIGKRIRQVRGALSQGEFADALGVSKSAVGSYERDAQAPGSTVIVAICERFGIDPAWLLFGFGVPKNDSGDAREITRLPLMRARLAGDALEPLGVEGRAHPFRRDFLENLGDPERMVLLRVDGDSMAPEILHGDTAIIDQGQAAPRPGGLFAVSMEGMVYIKRIDALPGRIVFKSCNPAYPPIEVALKEAASLAVRILGLAVWLCRSL